ncbi:MAG: type IV toxin-antitoxin system AbiEi family antitoxin domain-containing protein, partial [Clostridia bacterium]|nr:type IV toxin-antitoxin system AbiEi family antitoxin domain-containing protein [Clostridia bacterium]MDY5555726.1 type IV toxin-antitoxin system AbiEi family antitoxin domain-containing protein [Blautia sp.]
MLRENDIKNVRKLFNRHHYVMTTAELLEAKLYYADIKQLLDEGFIERIRRGYYHWIENCEVKEIVIINSLFP